MLLICGNDTGYESNKKPKPHKPKAHKPKPYKPKPYKPKGHTKGTKGTGMTQSHFIFKSVS